MRRFLNFLTHSRTLSVLGVLALTIILLLIALTFEIGLVWAGIALGVLLALWLATALWKRWRARRASARLEGVLEQAADKSAAPDKREEVEALRVRLAEAVKTIKRSKLGQLSGDAALYELPWYIVIGNPAAGKSTAVLNSGLQFPFADKGGAVIQGIGGTRNCDWFFTTEGILLDTAGRYSVHEEDRREWLGFLDLLKRYRPKAPINGIVVTVSVSELTQNRPEFAINLAKNLRQRVQELTERLEVFAPVYVMFTKADLITGFTEFFGDSEKQERDRVWGATLPFEPDAKPDVAALFDQRFDELCDGLKEISVAQISLHQKNKLSPGLLSFPLEFASIKPALRAFLVTLFDENPFQYKPVFRGFYFTSALQEGATNSASAERIARRFGLSTDGAARSREVFSKNGFFLRDLFSKVIFSDRQTVRQFASPAKTRLRIATFFGLVLALGLLLGGWTWSYMGNRTLTANVQADLDKIVKLQQNRVDLQARLEALDILQDRIEQLERFRGEHPLALSLGLYQGDALQHKLLDEYYNGLRQVMLKPVGGALETFLAEVNTHPEQLAPMVRPPETGAVIATSVTSATATIAASGAAAGAPASASPTATATAAAPAGKRFTDASPSNVEDGYNALKTYLMLSDKRHVEVAHLTDQITRFWRGWLEDNRGNMPREQMIRSAERNLSFFLARVNDDNWPLLEGNLSLIDQTRENLRRVVRGMPARERAYAEIKARASTRYAPMTVARIVGETGGNVIAGSYAVPGTFTKEAWQGYVQPAIREAASKELQTKDWVLNVAARDDLTLEGSPEQIQKTLVTMYKTEYAREWQRFMQGVAVQDFTSFEQAVAGMNLLGDPTNSPIRKVLDTAYDQTSWDNPSMLNAGLKQAKSGVLGWFKQLFARQTPSQINVNVDVGGNAETGSIPMGPVGKEFAGLARVAVMHDDKSLLRGYMDALSKVRTRFNLIKNQGDPGPGARQLMQQTLDGNGSELADTLKYVDEQMLTGMTDSERQTLRPLLVRPLLQSYAVVIRPASVEINKVWNAQVYQPFSQTLAEKYPFAANAKIEASAAEIGQIFGPEGAIAKFANTTIGPLSVRRGDMLAARTWGDLGLAFVPEFTAGFTRWIAPLTGGAAGGAGGAAAAAPQTVFQILPVPSQGTTEYTIEIDGQQLRYRNTPPQWANFVWPNPQGAPGARVTATTFDGRTVELLNEPGRFGLERLIATANRKRRPDGAFDLTWARGDISVSVSLRIISSPQTAGTSGSDSPQGQGLRGLRLPTSIADATASQNTATPPAPAGSRPASAAAATTQATARTLVTQEQGGTAQ
ncbi:type VI secretion system membrane subunit TssM [Ralstonia pseudosolanacearum]|uniref:type VI secretion system membrane subunit TssM n=1 Tax=Ralstonia pseudosolanacearum TaxID=1310165 RepID=UPI000A396EE3|nr:type VI secretion system membrane subunit TssM [Ralstonia pseudosolanacearum]ARS59247.1 type VI secretion protein VasK [Ralstonia solanacearum FJAT-91]QKZ30244.1 type VI secretion system membrane subunit TssM [Ralstonia solanacearum]MCK4149535.1 type VI secretion system membrane subunit TssM [Ralstonia pseudosolanacearum]QKZ34898.1 type VI secretion system membrane subunit TssM [Ralstonia solanacearum]QMT12864.1 type VI secretion system membrane subunit TssM [Ralstonia solanacearum]